MLMVTVQVADLSHYKL